MRRTTGNERPGGALFIADLPETVTGTTPSAPSMTTTLATGEEGDEYTTLAIGEEGDGL